MKIFLNIIISSILLSQEYKIQFSHIPMGQGIIQNDSIGFMSSVGSGITNTASSDSFSLGVGFLESSQNAFSEPPTITDIIFPSNFGKSSTSQVISATLYDLNGIKSVEMELQIGGGDEVVMVSMLSSNNELFEATISDSIFKVENFRARIIGLDNMGEATFSEYYSSETYIRGNELSMSNDYSYYPNGIIKDQWKLVSWPAKLFNNSLLYSELNEGHVFYRYRTVKKDFVIADSLELGKAYWFQHKYNKPVVFDEDSSIAIPLSNYSISLSKGWNLIGSPFSFPVTFEKDSIVGDIYTYGDIENEGWSDSQTEMYPWNGYVVYTEQESEITLIPFIDNESASRSLSNIKGWLLSLYIEDESFFNYTSKIGIYKDAKDGLDSYDSPSLPNIDQNIDLVMDLNGDNLFNYSKDIRSEDNFNGIWNLRINGGTKNRPILLNGILEGLVPEDLVIALIDIQKRESFYDFVNDGVELVKDSGLPYDLKLVAGDIEYVNMTVQEILNNIPIEFSLGQNYPNPFNPITKINYTLPKYAKVNVSIYNVLGQKVITLLDKKKEYGYHTLIWNGTNSFGKQMATGVYFAKMSSGKFTQTKKMLLLK
jgi:hypothetical protein